MLIASSTLELSGKLVCLWLHPETDPPIDEWNVVIQRIVDAKKRTGIAREKEAE